MTHVLVQYDAAEEDEPNLIYSQLDEDRREIRRVEFYPNGLCFAFGGDHGHEEALSPEPFPEDLRDLNRPGEVTARPISAALFQEIWSLSQEAPDGLFGMFT